MTNLKSAFDALEAFVQPTATTATTAPVVRSTAAPRLSNKLPLFGEITVANAYLFINDDKYRRYVVNFQLFTENSPFTPDKSNAAYLGTAVLRNPYVFENAMGRYKDERQDSFPHHLWQPRYRDQIANALKLPSTSDQPEFPVIGQLEAQGPGRNYELGSLIRAYVDQYDGLRIDLLLMDGTISFEDFTFNPEKPKTPRAFASFDPHRLWVPKQRGGRKRDA
jgi:hypothetical protein